MPDAIRRSARDDRAAVTLVKRVNGWLWIDMLPRVGEREKIRFHLQIRERLRDRLPYVRHLFNIIVKPRLARGSTTSR